MPSDHPGTVSQEEMQESQRLRQESADKLTRIMLEVIYRSDVGITPAADITVYTDSSFAPAGRQSQAGIAVFLTYATVRHLIHWQSSKEKKMAESSAESELYALSAGHKIERNFRLMVHMSP